MRFVFENGGRGGMRDAEALSHGMAIWLLSQNMGALFVDFSVGRDQKGELFCSVEELRKALGDARRHALLERFPNQESLDAAYAKVANHYWAKAEAILLDRVAKESTPAAPTRL